MSKKENMGCGYPVYWILAKIFGVTPRDIVDPWGYDEEPYVPQPNSIEILKRTREGGFTSVNRPVITNTRTGTEGYCLKVNPGEITSSDNYN